MKVKGRKSNMYKMKHKIDGNEIDVAENNYFCLCCLEAFTNSKPNEIWTQCIECKLRRKLEVTRNFRTLFIQDVCIL